MVEGFALMSYASAIEPLRAANLLAGQEIYRISHLSAAGGPISSSSGASVETLQFRAASARFNVILVVAGGDPMHTNHDALMR